LAISAPTTTARWAKASWTAHQIICPRHGARFDIRNGKALTCRPWSIPPGTPVRVVDGWVEVGLPL
jgi:nitrite reductase/ring-hydroxylating ferredoxin subunit